MTIRYEANPPKIGSVGDAAALMDRFLARVRKVSGVCDAVHVTENVLGFERVSPLDAGTAIRDEMPGLPITASLRVRDRSAEEVADTVSRYADAGFEGVLVLMGDPRRSGGPDSGLVPSEMVSMLSKGGMGSRIKLYLSISNRPDFGRIKKKLAAGPAGFVSQVVQDAGQVRELREKLDGFEVIPTVLFPSPKNAPSAGFLGLDMSAYGADFGGFVEEVHSLTGDVLLTSPADFAGLLGFLRDRARGAAP